MRRRRDGKSAAISRQVLLGAALALAIGVSPAMATLLPTGFFDRVPVAQGQQMAITADRMDYNQSTGAVIAEGGVTLSYQGYKATADRVTYDQKTGDVTLIGHVAVRDPDGVEYTTDRADVTGGYKTAFLHSLAVMTPDGALVTADSADYAKALKTTLENASYAPCGHCVDDKGRTIGWRLRAVRMALNQVTHIVYIEQPRLEVLGVPIAWLPFMWAPDPTQPGHKPIGRIEAGYDLQYGVKFGVPLYIPTGATSELFFTPTLFSRQGLMLGLDWHQKAGGLDYSVSASGIYQLDPSAYAGEPGNRRWRGALQTSGHFEPVDQWTVGWSYTAFSDPAYLKDYDKESGDYVTNEVYAEHLGRNSYANIRAQDFRLIGNVTSAAQDKQARTLPNARGAAVIDLGDNAGRLTLEGSVLGVSRAADDAETVNSIDYVHGFEGGKSHAMGQAGWTRQFETGAGVLFTPYLGVRFDAASYDGASSLASAPPDSTLFAATPIAALDMRYPLMARMPGAVHIIEPIAQLVYRGNTGTETGITNDDAQSFVFEDTNLFSYNRFSGADRQETGLRANVGAHYQANFADGSWYDIVFGQSFSIAGANAFATSDAAQTGTSSGLSTNASYFVAGAKASFAQGLTLGGKVQVDPAGPRVTRGVATGEYDRDGFSVGVDYAFDAADAALGVLADRHEVGTRFGLPLDDYWKATAGFDWDISAQSWLEASAGLQYDDGYVAMGLTYTATGPTNTSPNDHRIMATFMLKGPDGQPL